MSPSDYIEAARVPLSVSAPQDRGLWQVIRFFPETEADKNAIGFPHQTRLCRWTFETLHKNHGEIVMEDSRRELSKHLPIWMSARGRVLKTGLGLGCVVRGLLANADVDLITVIEIDDSVIQMIAPEFASSPRVEIIHANALEWEPEEGRRWDFAWHDIWTDGPSHLQLLHAKLACKFKHHCGPQGAWEFPRQAKKRIKKRGVQWLG
jgi:hypothetical protein